MKLDISKVEFSNSDIKRKIKVPERLTVELCEIVGIIAGDGCLYKRKNRYEIYIYGNSIDDIKYHKEIVKNLFKEVFNLEPKIHKIKDTNAIRTRIDSKAIFVFFNKVLCIPYGNKVKNLGVQNNILTSKKSIYPYLRGLADTDFGIKFKKRNDVKPSLYKYPIIYGNFASKEFAEQLSRLIKKIGFNNHIERNKRNNLKTGKYYESFSINIIGKENLKTWMKKIGFNNRRHLTKYLLWKKLGYCTPLTTLQEREILLKSL